MAAAVREWWPVLVNLAISVPLAMILNIRLDEGYTLQTTGGGLRYAWSQALRFELQPPFFFALLSLWRKLDHSILFARFFSVICAAITVRLAFDLARRYVPDVPPVIVALIVAVHPFVIWNAVDIRVYAFALLLSALLLITFHDGYLVDEGSWWARWAYLLLAVVALYTQYYLGFLLLANALVLLVQRRWAPLRGYLCGMIGVGVLFLPMLSVLYQQVFVHTKDITQHDSFRTSANDFMWIVKGHILPADSTKFQYVRRWIQLIGEPLLAILLFMNRKRAAWQQFVPIWVITLILLPIFLFLRYRIGYDFFSPKHTTALFFPAVLSFVALVWSAAQRRGVWVWLALVAGASLVSLYAVYRPMAKMGDWRRSSEFVMAHEKPDEPILFFSATAAVPFGNYYRGPNRQIPLPQAEKFDTYDIERYVLHSGDEISAGLHSAPGSHESVWLVTDSFCRLQAVDFNCPLLEKFVSQYYEVESDQQFYGSRVRHLRLKAMARDPGF